MLTGNAASFVGNVARATLDATAAAASSSAPAPGSTSSSAPAGTDPEGAADLPERDAVDDAVEAATGAQRLAVFVDPFGNDNSYVYSAATLAAGVGLAGTSSVISLPYSFMKVWTDPEEATPGPGVAARARLLSDVLQQFGMVGGIEVSGVTAPEFVFGTSRYPNPFNPQVHIACAVGKPGHLQVRVFDLRGRLVQTLLDENVTSSVDLVWNGRDMRGADVASGIYFYEARLHGDVQMGKMTLVR